jgi:hypothetical protein
MMRAREGQTYGDGAQSRVVKFSPFCPFRKPSEKARKERLAPLRVRDTYPNKDRYRICSIHSFGSDRRW